MSDRKIEVVSGTDSRAASWLNRNVVGMTITSFLSDAGHEMVTAVLPGFLGTIGVAAAALGWIEGVSDASASFVKLGAGWYSDRIGHRKRIVTAGYFITGTALALFAAAVSWPLVLVGRVISWFGRGIRSPLRDAMLAESVAPSARGKAFGLHRAGDTIGAVVGPLVGVGLLTILPAPNAAAPFRTIFLLSLIPGVGSAVSFAALVREKRRPEDRSERFWGAVSELPKPYTRFLRGVGLFGLGDFSPTLLILAATQLLSPAYGAVHAAQIAGLLYVLRNIVYAGASFPIGMLGDRMNKAKLLAAGYPLGVLTAAGIAATMAVGVQSIWSLAVVFVFAGAYIAAEDALEGAIPAEMVPSLSHGTAYGLMGAVNGVGDLGASVLVGSLWTAVSSSVAFAAAGILMLLGAFQVARNSRSGVPDPS
jgi:MFS family permease